MSQDMESTKISTYGCMDKENVVSVKQKEEKGREMIKYYSTL
jgi:hypothetical protein